MKCGDDMTQINKSRDSSTAETNEPAQGALSLPTPDISRMGYNPANFAYWIGTGPWVSGYSVYYAISFYDAMTQTESTRSDWWGPKTDPKKLYGGLASSGYPWILQDKPRHDAFGGSSRGNLKG
jgi:hypothetical protein